jgi:Uma2 family endonuclease
MFMAATHTQDWTLEDVERLIDAREGYTPRYELVDGELLVTPGPNGRHQRIVAELFILVRAYVEEHRLGEARLGPGAVTLGPDTYFEPDLYVVPAVNGKRPRALDPVTQVLLATEVLSPSSARHDRVTKRRYFQAHGVPAYWIVDGEAEVFEIWNPGSERPAIIDQRLVWAPRLGVPPFELDVKHFFASVADE